MKKKTPAQLRAIAECIRGVRRVPLPKKVGNAKKPRQQGQIAVDSHRDTADDTRIRSGK